MSDIDIDKELRGLINIGRPELGQISRELSALNENMKELRKLFSQILPNVLTEPERNCPHTKSGICVHRGGDFSEGWGSKKVNIPSCACGKPLKFEVQTF